LALKYLYNYSNINIFAFLNSNDKLYFSFILKILKFKNNSLTFIFRKVYIA
jgi:hypothetical protein